MCLAIPGKVIKIKGKQVWIQYPETVNQALVADRPVKNGDMVLVQMGIIIKKMTQKESRLSQKAWEK